MLEVYIQSDFPLLFVNTQMLAFFYENCIFNHGAVRYPVEYVLQEYSLLIVTNSYVILSIFLPFFGLLSILLVFPQHNIANLFRTHDDRNEKSFAFNVLNSMHNHFLMLIYAPFFSFCDGQF